MRRVIIILLTVVAIPLYAWNVYVLVAGALSKQTQRGTIPKSTPQQSVETTLDQLIAAARPVVFTIHGKNPFVAYVEQPKPVVKQTAAPTPKAPPKPSIPPPSIVITGIMWNATSPVVMLKLPDGTSAVAKAGQDLGVAVVKRVEKNRALFRYEGGEFWVER